RRAFFLALVSCILLNLADSASAEGWQMPNLNPFAEKAAAKPAAGKPWLPGAKKTQTATGPSTWEKVKSAPASMVNGTKKAVNAVNPFKSDAPPKHSRPLTGSNLDKQPASKSWFSKFVGEEKKSSEPPMTVSDWIAGPRPE